MRTIERRTFDVHSVHHLLDAWNKLQIKGGVFSESDIEIYNQITELFEQLIPYQARSPEERTALLFASRTAIEGLLARIDESPTYWGRVHFEPLLSRWKRAIQDAERTRLREIQPILEAELEPPLLSRQGDHLVGGLRVHNRGRGTAVGVTLELAITRDGETVYRATHGLESEIGVGMNEYFPLQVKNPVSTGQYHEMPVLNVRITSANAPGIALQKYHTLEVAQDVPPIDKLTIPWNETRIPPAHLFKGREDLIERLANHLTSSERSKTYILYGLTRTGKSSILTYLNKRIDQLVTTVDGARKMLVACDWNLQTAAGQTAAKDMWYYLLVDGVIEKVRMLRDAGVVEADAVPFLRNEGNVRFRDFEVVIAHLAEHRLYPVFLIDEFSVYRDLVRSGRLDAPFLASIREYAIGGRASFVLAGTFDMRRIMYEPAYGITGQFVNANVAKVSRIDRTPAIELIRAMEPALLFTEDALDRILLLSYQIPYFIQILCKYCALYASETSRHVIGAPELETVTAALVGEVPGELVPGVDQLPLERFQNNMHSPADPPEMTAVLTTLAHLNVGRVEPRFVTYSEISGLWHQAGVAQLQR